MALSSLNNTAWYTSLTSKRGLVGGVLELKLWEQVYPASSITATNSVGIGAAIDATHDVVISGSGGADYPSGAATIRFAPEQSTFTASTAQENGLALTTCAIEGFVPNLTSAELVGLQNLIGKGLMGVVKLHAKESNSQIEILIGWDNILGDIELVDVSGTDVRHLTSKFALFLESIEITSGSAMTDEVGATIRLTAVQGEVPRRVSAS